MSSAVFTYGTLMFPPVWHAVTGAVSFGEAATLEGFARRTLRGRSYPGLVREAGSVVEGMLYDSADESALKCLDAFEGDEYQRVEVVVRTAGGSRSAATYVLSTQGRRLVEAGSWTPSAFAREIAGFLRSRIP